jgi:hypothetical protein
LALSVSAAHADHGGTLKWRSGKSSTPVIVLQPVSLTAEQLAAVYHGAAAWNDTGYVRYLVAPMVDSYTSSAKGTVPIRSDATLNDFTSASSERGYLTGSTVHLCPCDSLNKYGVTHELGHVLGLGHSQGTASVLSPRIDGSCPGTHDLEELGRKYPRDKGRFTVPERYTYQRGGVDCSDNS